jgi:hypothetical protein
MLRHSDDDLYKIHSRWLGPAGFTLPLSVPMKGIPVGAAAATLTIIALRAFGVTGLPMWLLTIVIATAIAKVVISVTGHERPVLALATLLLAEVSAPRPAAGNLQTGVLEPALLCRVAFGQRDRYQATVCSTASRCAVGSRRPKAASNLLASTTKGARNW